MVHSNKQVGIKSIAAPTALYWTYINFRQALYAQCFLVVHNIFWTLFQSSAYANFYGCYTNNFNPYYFFKPYFVLFSFFQHLLWVIYSTQGCSFGCVRSYNAFYGYTSFQQFYLMGILQEKTSSKVLSKVMSNDQKSKMSADQAHKNTVIWWVFVFLL